MEQLVKKILEQLGIEYTPKRLENLTPIIEDKKLSDGHKAVEICDTLGIDDYSPQRHLALRTVKWILK